MAKICPSCGKPVPDHARYCPNCGAELSGIKKCPYCGVTMPQDQTICPNCFKDTSAASKDTPQPTETQPAKPSTPDFYIGDGFTDEGYGYGYQEASWTGETGFWLGLIFGMFGIFLAYLRGDYYCQKYAMRWALIHYIILFIVVIIVLLIIVFKIVK